jgi:hypothetical protein
MKKVPHRPVLKWFYFKLLKQYVRSESVPLTWTQLIDMVLIRIACRNSGLLQEILDGLFWSTMNESYKTQLISWKLRGYSQIPALVECPQPDLIKKAHPLDDSPRARFPEPELRRAVAVNPNAPMAVLAVLACDPDKEVRLAVAKSPAATPQILACLAVDESEDVRHAVAENPKADGKTLLNLALVKYRSAA